MAATVRILERDGFHGLTTRRVAAEAGTGIATVYDWFEDKYALVRAVVRTELDALARELAASRYDPCRPMLVQFLEVLLHFLEARRALARALLDERPDILGLADVATASRQFARLLDPMIVECRGRLPDTDLFLIRSAIRGMLLEFARSDDPVDAGLLAERMTAWIESYPSTSPCA